MCSRVQVSEMKACVVSFISEMAHLHCRRRTQVQTRIPVPNPMVTLYCAEYVLIAQTRTRTSATYFSIGQDSEHQSVTESVSGKK